MYANKMSRTYQPKTKWKNHLQTTRQQNAK